MSRLLAVLVVATVLVSACTSQAPGGSGGTPTSEGLVGTAWTLAQFGDDLPSVPDDVTATLTFGGPDDDPANTASGSGGCNRFSGSYSLGADDALEFGPIAATQRACAAPVSTVEGAFFAALEATDSHRLDGDTLTLLADGQEVAVLTRQDVPTLLGPTWVATGINNGKEAVVSLVADTEPTAVFGADGRITGDSTCNTFNGPYESDGEGALAIGPLASTKKACADEDAAVQEAAYLAALQRATTYRFIDGTLELRDDDGALQVSFTAR